MQKKHRIRVRCPFCGALTWESQWNRVHPIEVYQQISHGGQGKHNALEFRNITNKEWVGYVRNAIIQRCLDILHWLNFEVEPVVVVSQSPSVLYGGRSDLVFSQTGEVVFR